MLDFSKDPWWVDAVVIVIFIIWVLGVWKLGEVLWWVILKLL